MSGEELHNNENEKLEETGQEGAEAEVAPFDAAAAKARVEQFKEEKAKAEREAEQARQEAERKRQEKEKEREEQESWRQQEREQEIQFHNYQWEQMKEETDLGKEIAGTFVGGINDMIKKAAEKGEEKIDLVVVTTLYDGMHQEWDMGEDKVSLLTGKALNLDESSYDDMDYKGPFMIDEVFKKDSERRKEFSSEIREMADETIPKVIEMYKENGYVVETDEKGNILSVSWGESAEPEPEPTPKPQKKKSIFESLFNKKN